MSTPDNQIAAFRLLVRDEMTDVIDSAAMMHFCLLQTLIQHGVLKQEALQTFFKEVENVAAIQDQAGVGDVFRRSLTMLQMMSASVPKPS